MPVRSARLASPSARAAGQEGCRATIGSRYTRAEPYPKVLPFNRRYCFGIILILYDVKYFGRIREGRDNCRIVV
jgi:hypothetical protein